MLEHGWRARGRGHCWAGLGPSHLVLTDLSELIFPSLCLFIAVLGEISCITELSWQSHHLFYVRSSHMDAWGRGISGSSCFCCYCCCGLLQRAVLKMEETWWSSLGEISQHLCSHLCAVPLSETSCPHLTLPSVSAEAPGLGVREWRRPPLTATIR